MKFKPFFAAVCAIFALGCTSITVPAQAATAYYTPVATITAMKQFGAQSFLISHVRVYDAVTGGNFTYSSTTIADDGCKNYAPSAGAGTWIREGDFDWNSCGALPDGNIGHDGAITSASHNFTSALTTFSSADIGKTITVIGAGAAGADLTTTISGFTSTHVVTLTAAASTTVLSAVGYFAYGTDNATALSKWASASSGGNGIVPNNGSSYYSTGSISLNAATGVYSAGNAILLCSNVLCGTFTGSSSVSLRYSGLTIYQYNTSGDCLYFTGHLISWTADKLFCYAIPYSNGTGHKMYELNTGTLYDMTVRNYRNVYHAMPGSGGVNAVTYIGGEFVQDNGTGMTTPDCSFNIDGGIRVVFSKVHGDLRTGAPIACIGGGTLISTDEPPVMDGFEDSKFENIASTVPLVKIGTGTFDSSDRWPKAPIWKNNSINNGTNTYLLYVSKTGGGDFYFADFPGNQTGQIALLDADTDGNRLVYSVQRATGYTNSGTGNWVQGYGSVQEGLWVGSKIGVTYGGTNADLHASGGAGQVLQQSSTGAAITVGKIASTDLSDVIAVGSCALTFKGSTSGSNTTNICRYSTSASGTRIEFRMTGAVNVMVGNYVISWTTAPSTGNITNLFGGGYFYYFTPTPGAGAGQEFFRIQLDQNATTGNVVDVRSGASINSANITGTYDFSGEIDYF